MGSSRKLFLVSLLILVILSFSGCTEDNKGDDSEISQIIDEILEGPVASSQTVGAGAPLVHKTIIPVTSPHVDKDCSDFSTHATAQAYFETNGGSLSNNFDRLDADHDGLACESLP